MAGRHFNTRRYCGIVCSLAFGLLVAPQYACGVGTDLTTELVAAGFASPVYAVAPLGDTTRLFVVEQGGTIRIINLVDNSILPTPFLSLSVTSGGERGLLGLAFDPITRITAIST